LARAQSLCERAEARKLNKWRGVCRDGPFSRAKLVVRWAHELAAERNGRNLRMTGTEVSAVDT
jgi:hypothetical protein